MSDYHPQELDRKWQAHWAETQAFEVTEDRSKPKFYCLEMFAYPSGHAHVGHVRNYIIGDVVARLKRLQGFNVLHPFGWDAFGLPAENAAIKGGIHPEESTLGNIAHMKGQLQRLGISYAWGRELATCMPDYYRWNQWLFTRMFERGLAYRRRSTVNWCPVDNTVLANEQVVDGACWRCGTIVEQKDLEQWFFRITAYADELLGSAEGLSQWPEKVLTMQRNWIGRSEGARVSYPLADLPGSIDVFTTRIDTIYGATFVMLGPEHPLVQQFADLSADPFAFREQVAKFRGQDRSARVSGEVEKEGFFTGQFAVNPFTDERVPVWVANFVLGEYGTGAVMAVPFGDQRDFEFARKYNLPVRAVIRPAEGDTPDVDAMTEALPEEGVLVNSGPYNGLTSAEARRRLTAEAEARGIGEGTVQFRLKDWGISRQRYWGTPIPDDPLPAVRRGAGARRSAARRPAEGGAVHRSWRFAAGHHPRVRERDLSHVRRRRAPRNRHDGHVRRLVVVLLPLRRRPQRPSAVRSSEGRVLVPGRFLQRRCRARDSAPHLLALLRARVPRPRHGDAQRAVHAPADAGHGAEGRRGDVEVEGQRGRPGHDA